MIYTAQSYTPIDSPYIVDCISVNFAHVVGAGLSLLDHLHSDGSKDAVFLPLALAHLATHSVSLLLAAHVAPVSEQVVVVSPYVAGRKEALVVARKLKVSGQESRDLTHTILFVVPQN
jgi:hypothetical protein